MAVDDELDFDPDDLDSIVRWSRRERLRGRSTYDREEEPQPKSVPKQRQMTDAQAASQVTQQWVDFIDARISDAVDMVAKVVGQETALNENKLRDQFRAEIKQAVERRPKVIIFDPSESLKKLVTKFSADLRAELAEIRKELGLRHKGEVLDLPSLRPRKRA